MAGTAGLQNPIVVQYTQSSTAAAGDNYVMTRAGTVIDAWLRVTTQAVETMTVGNGATAISNAMTVNAAATNITRSGSLVRTAYNLAVGNSLRFTSSGAGGRCVVHVMILPALANSTVIP